MLADNGQDYIVVKPKEEKQQQRPAANAIFGGLATLPQKDRRVLPRRAKATKVEASPETQEDTLYLAIQNLLAVLGKMAAAKADPAASTDLSSALARLGKAFNDSDIAAKLRAADERRRNETPEELRALARNPREPELVNLEIERRANGKVTPGMRLPPITVPEVPIVRFLRARPLAIPAPYRLNFNANGDLWVTRESVA